MSNIRIKYFVLFLVVYIFAAVSFSYSQFALSTVENTDTYTKLKITKTESKEDKNIEVGTLDALIAIPQGAKASIEAEGTPHIGDIAFEAPLRDVQVAYIKLNKRLINHSFSNNKNKDLFVFIKYQFSKDAKRNMDASKLVADKVDAFEKIYKDALSNYPFPDSYRSNSAAQKTQSPPFPSTYKNAIKVTTLTNGFYQVRIDDLKEKFDTVKQPISNDAVFHVWYKGSEQTVYIKGDDKTNPSIYFKVDSIDTRYTNQNVYWVTISDKNAAKNASYQQLPKDLRDEDITMPSIMQATQLKNLINNANRADYIIITHHNFINQANTLAQWRQKTNNFKTFVVDIDDIYNEFNYGIVDSEAIKSFLAYTYFIWQKPAPTYVMLLGDASENFKSDDPKFVKNFVPTYYPPEEQGNPDDASFVSFLGKGEFPAMIIGRLPVYDEKTANAVVNKIIKFEQKPEYGIWRGIISYLGDNDYEFLFDDDVTKSVPKTFLFDKIYVRDYSYVDHYAIPNVKISQDANDAVIRDLSRGNLGVHYVGHGGVTLLSHKKILFHTDVEELKNQGRLPFMVQISCNTGYFDFQEAQWRSSISELLLEKENGGAIGIFAAARRLGGSEKYLQELLFKAMYADAPTNFGIMTTEVKINYIASKGRGHFINNYHLLGDPAIQFTLPAPDIKVAATGWNIIGPLYNNKAHSITVKGVLTHPMSGNLTVGIYDEKTKQIAASTMKMTSLLPVFRKTFDLPAGLPAGEYSAFCYFWNADKKYDAIGKDTFKIEVPPYKAEIIPDTLPDVTLKANTIDFKTPNVKDGDTVLVDAKVTNLGTNLAENIPVACYVMKSKDKSFKLIKTLTVDKVLPGEVKDTIFRWDDFDTAGNATFKVVIDAENKVKETNKNNNTIKTVLKIKTKPNLMIDPAEAQVKEESGNFNVRFIVTNDGEWDAIPSTMQIYLGTEKRILGELGGDVQIPAIPAKGKTKPFTLTFPMPKMATSNVDPSQINTIFFRLDAKTKISEVNEDDDIVKYRFKW